MSSIQRWSNDARIRSVMAGAVGGMAGWVLAEVIIRQPNGTLDNLCFGLIVGLGIGATLGAAEGMAIQSWRTLQRGLVIGLMLGAGGGAFGAMVGQIGYQFTTNSTTRPTESGNSDSGTEAGSGGIFNPRVREIQRRVQQAGGSQGEIEIALGWNNTNDLDLHVIDPNGFEIYFGSTRSPSGGWLDVDQNAGCSQVTTTPVEHVFWSQADALPGRYQVYVKHFSSCERTDPTDFDVVVTVGDEVTPIAGSIEQGVIFRSKKLVHSFEYGSYDPVAENPDRSYLPFLAVIFGWTVFGALVGCGQGLTRGSAIAVRNASIGGAVGGFIGGLVMVTIILSQNRISGASLNEGADPSWIGRMMGFVILGACIGLWIVIIERALSAALTVVSGRFEGREILLVRPETRIGRLETLDVYLGGDPQIASHHVTICKEAGAHVARRAEQEVLVNDMPISEQALRSGDRITIGQTRLIYRHKAMDHSPDVRSSVADSSTPLAPPAPPPPPPPPSAKRGNSSAKQGGGLVQPGREPKLRNNPSQTPLPDGPKKGRLPPPPPPPPPPPR